MLGRCIGLLNQKFRQLGVELWPEDMQSVHALLEQAGRHYHAQEPTRSLAPALPDRTMNFFSYKNGELCAEEVSLAHLAREVGTPFYCYSSAALERHYKVFAAALPKDSLIAFSVKANGLISSSSRSSCRAISGSRAA